MHPKIAPTPTWQSYAERIIARLTAQQNGDGHTDDPAHRDAQDESDHNPRDNADREDRGKGPGGRDGDAEPAPDDTAPHLSPQRLSLVLRLAATLGSEAALRSSAAPGAITVISGCDPDEVELIRQYVRTGVFAPDLRVTLRLRHHGTDGELLLLGLAGSDGAISGSARRSFLRHLNDALERSGGLILLVPDTNVLPPNLQPGASPGVTHLRLAPLDRTLLMAQLRHSHDMPDRATEAVRHEALPDDHILATLPSATLRLALRAPDAQGVAERLAALTAPRRADGPTLETMTGDGAALRAARRLVADLRLWQGGEIGWTDLTRSMLLYGPPGTGKTWLARAMGASAGVTLVEASFAQWQAAGHLGDLLREMRASFAEARRRAPALLFIDEIDAVGSREDPDSHGSRYQAQVINGFLGEMDSISREPGVIVIGACNYPNRIDPAVLRPGRFDLKVAVPLPDRAALRGMLQHHLGAELPDEALERLATAAVGQSASQIDAAIRAARSEARHDRVPLSAAMITRHMGDSLDEDRTAFDWRAAVHECGHAIVGAVLGCGIITRLLLTPSGGEIHLQQVPKEGLLTEIEAQIAYVLAGRAAEGLVLGRLSGGAGGPAGSDLAMATRLALHIETRLGLGLAGPIWTDAPDHEGLADPQIRDRVRRRLEAAESRAAAVLAAREPLLREMAAALLRERELAGKPLENWLSRVVPNEGRRGHIDRHLAEDHHGDLTASGAPYPSRRSMNCRRTPPQEAGRPEASG